MPNIEVVKTGAEIGRETDDNHKYMYHPCIDCGRALWVRFKADSPVSSRCRKCAAIKRAKQWVGENNPFWKGGRAKTAQGYITVLLQPDDFFFSMTITRGRVLEHRLIMAKYLGRCLHRWEIVHHKNHIRDDNRIENLQLVSEDRHTQISLLERRIERLETKVDEQSKEIKLLHWQLKEQREPIIYGNR